MKIIILSLLLASCMANTSKLAHQSLLSQGSATKMFNLGYLAMGYNLYKGNPLNSYGAVDPGFTFHYIFNLTYNSSTTTMDGRFLVPDGINLEREVGCTLDYSTNLVSTESSYSNLLKINAEIEGQYLVSSFKANAEYQQIASGANSGSKIYTVSNGECRLYRGGIQTYSPPQLSTSFVNMALALPDLFDCNELSYVNFLGIFGTHFISGLTMGARYSFISSLTQQAASNLMNQKIDVSLAASYSAIFDVKGSLSTQIQRDWSNAFKASKESTREISIGSQPPADANVNTWANKAIEEPMPIKYTLLPLDELFTPTYFRDPATNQTKLNILRKNVQTALKEYCDYLKYMGKLGDCRKI